MKRNDNKYFKRIISGLMAFSVISSISSILPATATSVNSETSHIFYGEGYEISYEITDSWDNSQKVQVTLTNTGEKAIQNWALAYDAHGEISDMWDGLVIVEESTWCVVKNVGYNYEVQPETSVSYGYIVNGEDIGIPETIELCSKRVETSSEDYNVSLEVDDEWEDGFNGSIIIENLSNEPIEAWKVAFETNFIIDDIWNAQYSTDDFGYEVSGGDDTITIDPGNTVIIGVKGVKIDTTNPKLSNIFLSKVIISEDVFCEKYEEGEWIPEFVQCVIDDEGLGKVFQTHKLFNDDEQIVAYCLDLENGYMIFDTNGEIVEYSENKSPLYDIIDPVYYSGPFAYYTKESKKMINVDSGESISLDEFSEQSDVFDDLSNQKIEDEGLDNMLFINKTSSKPSLLQSVKSPLISQSSVLKTSSGSLRKIKTALKNKPRCLNYYTPGYCGRVAATTMLVYYQQYIDTMMLKASYYKDPRSLYDYMGSRNYFPYYTNTIQAHEHFNKIFNEVSHTTKYEAVTYQDNANSVWSFYRYLINTRRVPCMLLINNHPTYRDHWIVAYGVIAYYDTNNKVKKKQYVVNNGMNPSRNDVKIGSNYAVAFVYFD